MLRRVHEQAVLLGVAQTVRVQTGVVEGASEVCVAVLVELDCAVSLLAEALHVHGVEDLAGQVRHVQQSVVFHGVDSQVAVEALHDFESVSGFHLDEQGVLLQVLGDGDGVRLELAALLHLESQQVVGTHAHEVHDVLLEEGVVREQDLHLQLVEADGQLVDVLVGDGQLEVLLEFQTQVLALVGQFRVGLLLDSALLLFRCGCLQSLVVVVHLLRDLSESLSPAEVWEVEVLLGCGSGDLVVRSVGVDAQVGLQVLVLDHHGVALEDLLLVDGLEVVECVLDAVLQHQIGHQDDPFSLSQRPSFDAVLEEPLVCLLEGLVQDVVLLVTYVMSTRVDQWIVLKWFELVDLDTWHLEVSHITEVDWDPHFQ